MEYSGMLHCLLLCSACFLIRDVVAFRYVYLDGNETTRITTPGYPRGYRNREDIAWVVQTDDAHRLMVHFFHFSTERSFDYLRAGESTDIANETTVFFRWSGSKDPPVLLSDGSVMWLRFTSDSSATYSGIEMLLRSVISTESLTCSSDEFDCGHSVCIGGAYRCDGRSDCEDGSDERASCGCELNSCKTNGTCHPEGSTGFTCECQPGYTGTLCEQGAFDIMIFEPTTISSPLYPQRYERSLDVSWFLQTENNHAIRVTFLNFETKLDRDYLRAGDGADSQDATTLFFEWSGAKTPPVQHSNGTTMWLRFTSSHFRGFSGFQASVSQILSSELGCSADEFDCGHHVCLNGTYQCDYESDCLDGSDELKNCGLTRVITAGETTHIFSPFYPNHYMNGMDVTWTIKTDEQHKILITFSGFITPHGYDVLRAGNGADSGNVSTTFFSWSGSKEPPALLSSGREMWLRFSSNSYYTAQGFNLSATSVSSYEWLNCSAGEFDCGHSVCIKSEYTCDRGRDCVDGSDEEASCGCEFNSCSYGGTCHPVGGRGFRCECPVGYTGTKCNTGNFQRFIEANGSLGVVSPLWPDRYPNYQDHTWIITTENDWKISVTFNSFDIVEGIDFLTAGDGTSLADESTTFLRWSGSKETPDFVSKSSEMWIRFTSRYSYVNARGFNLSATSVPANESFPCAMDEYDCGHSICLNAGYWCDGHQDCVNGTDESHCTAPLLRMYDSKGTRLGLSVDVHAGMLHTFICVVWSARPATIKWYLDDSLQQISNQPTGSNQSLSRNTDSWTLTPSRANQGQELRCEASVPIWQPPFPYVSVRVNVTVPSDFMEPSKTPPGPVLEGDDVVLSCTAYANPKLPDFITWERDGSTDPLASEYSNGTSTLTLHSISRDQDGWYRCRGDNGVLPVSYSNQLDVIVQYCPEFSEPAASSPGPFSEGDDVVLSCTAYANPKPPDFITWERVGSTDSLPSVYRNGTSTLTLRSISRDQAGPYRCRGDNGVPPVTNSNQIYVIVHFGPEFSETAARSPGPFSEGDDVFLSCNADANPRPHGFIAWEKIGSNDSLPSVYSNGTSTLTLRSISRDQAGSYRCRGDNGVPPVTYSNQIDVIVQFGPEFSETAASSPGPFSEGDDVFLSCNADANPKPPDFITWERVGSTDSLPSVYSNGTSTLTLRSISRDQAGPYRCRGDNGVPPVTYSNQIDVTVLSILEMIPDAETGDPVSLYVIIIIPAVCSAVLIGIVLCCVFLCRRRNVRQKRVNLPRTSKETSAAYVKGDKEEFQNVGIPLHMYIDEGHSEDSPSDSMPDSLLEFPRDKLTIVRRLGQGSFGQVLLAKAEDIEQHDVITHVAVKTTKDEAGETEKENLLKELQAIQFIKSHSNIVKLMGICSNEDPVYVIVEYMSKGNLKDVLEASQGKGNGAVVGTTITSLTSWYLVNFALDVAKAMDWLTSHKCLHRDLAARKVLVGEDLVCKLSNFGLICDIQCLRIHQRKSKEPVPLRWMGLESVLDEEYTKESDVWSFGVLLWEIVTLGARPYPNMDFETVIAKLRNGYRMPRPKHCRIELYQLMMSCWAEKPTDRMSFRMITETLEKLSKQPIECISLEAYQECLFKVTVPADPDEKC